MIAKLKWTLAYFYFTICLPEIGFAKEIEIITKSGTWTKEQHDMIIEAAKVVDQRLGSNTVKACSYRNSWRGQPDYKGWARAMGVWRRQKKLTITVDAKDFPRKYLAKAFVGNGKIDDKADLWQNLEISFGREFLDNKKMLDLKNKDLWVRVIAHEIGHNLGLSHGGDPKADIDANYAGYFVTELGFCTSTDGRHGSDMGDRKLRRTWYQRFGVKK